MAVQEGWSLGYLLEGMALKIQGLVLLAAVVLSCLSAPLSSGAQVAPAPPSSKLVLLPYEEPGSTDPHATAVTKELAAELAAANLNAAPVPAMEHIDAIANAGKICTDNGASGILVAEGRYEQTKKVIPAPWVTILRYPTHVEFRLDEVSCEGAVRWSKTTTGDEAPTGVFSVGNLGAAVDSAFRTAVKSAVAARATAAVSAAPFPARPASVQAPTAASTYLLVPFEQPGIADPRAPDVTHSLFERLVQKKLTVKVGEPIDHFSAVADAPQLCAAGGAQAIIVPSVRVEQSSVTGRSHASLRLALLNCGGSVLAKSAADADMGNAPIMINFGAAVVAVSEQAMDPAISGLFAGAPK